MPLIPAARDSGLHLIRHIVAVTEADTGANDQLRLTPTNPALSILDDTPLGIRQHILMFVIGGDRRG
jgi:hypothetical protein